MASLPWEGTHRFSSVRAARALAFECGTRRGHHALLSAHLVLAAKAISWLVPIDPGGDEGGGDRPFDDHGGCLRWRQLLRRGEEEEEVPPAPPPVVPTTINVDRLYLAHPAATVVSALTVAPAAPRCERCDRAHPSGSAHRLRLCAACFRFLVHDVLAASRPHDFGSLDHWEREHQARCAPPHLPDDSKGGDNNNGDDDGHCENEKGRGGGGGGGAGNRRLPSDEWFLNWDLLKEPLLEMLHRHLLGAASSHRHGLVALVPGNGRSEVAERLAACKRTTGARGESPLFTEVIVTDAARNITESMAEQAAASALDYDSTDAPASSSSSSSSSSSLLRFATDDIRHSHLESGSVDCILDKGLLDALACCYEDAVTQERPVLRQRSQGKQYQKQYQRGTQGEREAVSEYARLLRRGGVVVVNSGRPRRSTLGPFGLEEEQDQEGENDQKESSTSSASSISRSNSRSK